MASKSNFFCELLQIGLVEAIGRSPGLMLEMVFPHATQRWHHDMTAGEAAVGALRVAVFCIDIRYADKCPT